MSTEMIKITGLKKSYGSLEVLKGIDLTIAEKEVVVIIGPSGSGKSTLLRCMNYLEEPTEGTIVVDGIKLDGEANINKGFPTRLILIRTSLAAGSSSVLQLHVRLP